MKICLSEFGLLRLIYFLDPGRGSQHLLSEVL